MGQKTFLGKSIPEPHRLQAKPRLRSSSWVLFFLAPTAIFGFMIYLYTLATPTQPFTLSNQRTVSQALDSSEPVRVLGDNIGPVDPDPCAYSKISGSYNPTTIFPLLPTNILSQAPSSGTTFGCTPPYWNLDIFKVLAWKIIGLLNWVALTIAVILTIYSGLLYISGFANEGNVKKAKSILIAAYVGLIIVLTARIILFGTIQTLTQKSIDPNSISP